MFLPVDQSRSFRADAQGAVVRIGCFVVAINVASRETALIDEIAEFYGPYPRAAQSELPDFVIELRSRVRASPAPDSGLSGRSRPLSGCARAPGAPDAGVGAELARVDVHGALFLLVHAAVLERDGRAVVMPGPSGVGKSTLCAALVARGWRLLSDEVAMIRTAGRSAPAIPAADFAEERVDRDDRPHDARRPFQQALRWHHQGHGGLHARAAASDRPGRCPGEPTGRRVSEDTRRRLRSRSLRSRRRRRS